MRYFSDPDNVELIERLKSYGLQFQVVKTTDDSINKPLNGKSFVVSGVFENYEREELKNVIKNHGGKVLSSVSGKLDFLLAGNNMGPAKLKKASDLKVKIISEEEFVEMLNE